MASVSQDSPAVPEPLEAPASELDLRSMIGESLNREATRERIDKLIDNALEIKGLVSVYCPSCRKKLQAEYPDYKKQVDVLRDLANEAWGKPREEAATGTTIIVERPSRDDG